MFQANEFNANQWVDEKEIPYTYPPDAPYNWVRVRLLGGRSLFWARQSFRLSDYEFKAAEIDGTGDNWPISLEDLAPYYSRVEQIFRVAGRKEGWPQFPDGDFVETQLSAGYGLDQERSPRLRRSAASAFPSGAPRWAKTGWRVRSICCCRMRWRPASSTLCENAIVREISVDKNTGLGERRALRGPALRTRDACEGARGGAGRGCLESTRLLLNSKIATRAA